MMTRFAISLLLLAIGCSSATATDGTFSPIGGTWRYTGRQTAPRDAQLAGTLEIRSQRGQAFDGQLTTQSTDPQGTVRVSQGIVTGSFASAALLDFDADTPDGGIRHVGSVRGDTISGTWASDNGSTGTFLAIRQP